MGKWVADLPIYSFTFLFGKSCVPSKESLWTKEILQNGLKRLRI